MITKKRTKSLNDQLTFMQTLIDAIPSPIFYKDREVKFQGCNTAFEVLAGKERKAIIGRPADEVIPKLLADISHETDRIHSVDPSHDKSLNPCNIDIIKLSITPFPFRSCMGLMDVLPPFRR